MPQEPLAGKGNDIWGRLVGEGCPPDRKSGEQPQVPAQACATPRACSRGKEGQSGESMVQTVPKTVNSLAELVIPSTLW